MPPAKLPVNRWTTLYAGQSPTHVPGRMVWLPGSRQGLVTVRAVQLAWWNVKGRESAIYTEGLFFSPEKGAWDRRPMRFAENLNMDRDSTGPACAWLPGLKKVLLVHPPEVLRPKPDGTAWPDVTGWLYDPERSEWTPIKSGVSMSDRPSDFGAAPSQGQYQNRWAGPAHDRVPRWGAVAYDAHNREAVFFGGGGPWGRVGNEKEKVAPGDWIFDEVRRRVRRLTPDDAGKVAEARKWFPGHCGTWVFSEETLTWKPIEQPLGRQPPGRIVPALAYDAQHKKIVLFGGDDYTRCLGDTWVYDCATRTWQEVHPKVSPPPRALAAMVYVPGQDAVLMAGGYGSGWQGRSDTWIYRVAENTWTRLAVDVPAPAAYASADVDHDTKAVLLFGANAHLAASGFSLGFSTHAAVCALRLDLASAPISAAPADPGSSHHCKGPYDFSTPLPAEYLSEANQGLDAEAGRKLLAGLPANTWVLRKMPLVPRGRQWGSYVYDARRHTVLAWGGGHWGYTGNDVHEYDVVANRWRTQADPVAYTVRWWHGMGNYYIMSFQGWKLMGLHASRAYGVDVPSDSLLTLHGDVYSLKHHMVVGNIGLCPGGSIMASQIRECYVGAPHGLYAYGASGELGPAVHRADVAAGRWDLVAKGGPPKYNEHNHACYDSTRDRIVYFHAVRGKWSGAPAPGDPAAVWTFDFKTRKWTGQQPAGPEPVRPLGTSTYIPAMDAAFMIYAPEQGEGPEAMYFYKVGQRKWFTAAVKGDAALPNRTGRDSSPFYDPELKLLVRATHGGLADGLIQLLVMRLEPDALELAPLQSPGETPKTRSSQ
jgi:hypothetical protein